MRAEDMEKAKDALWFGLFPADEATLGFLRGRGTLEKPVDYPHVTFGYKIAPPADIDWDAVYDVVAFAYGNDGENEGYAVFVPDEIGEMYFGAELPHITLSTSANGAPVNTAFLSFDNAEPFTIPMKFGFYMRGKHYV